MNKHDHLEDPRSYIKEERGVTRAVLKMEWAGHLQGDIQAETRLPKVFRVIGLNHTKMGLLSVFLLRVLYTSVFLFPVEELFQHFL